VVKAETPSQNGFTPGQLSHCTPVFFPNTLGPSVLMVFPQAFEYSSLRLLVLSSLPWWRVPLSGLCLMGWACSGWCRAL